jgi:hypothetical protein
MRIFLFVNLLFITLLARPVGSFAIQNNTIIFSDTITKWDPAFGDAFQKSLFRVTFDISDNHLTGFIFIKKISDTSYRILFSNDFGMQIFDFEFLENEFIIHYCFPSMNRKSLLKLLENDFRILLFSDYGIKKIIPRKSDYKEDLTYKIKTKTGKWKFRISGTTRKILSVQSVGKFISKTRIELDHSIDSITGINISNPLIKLHISMTRISR